MYFRECTSLTKVLCLAGHEVAPAQVWWRLKRARDGYGRGLHGRLLRGSVCRLDMSGPRQGPRFIQKQIATFMQTKFYYRIILALVTGLVLSWCLSGALRHQEERMGDVTWVEVSLL
eukprot:scaffold15743_cov13-Tisochrysis_lutea.AAC.1